MTPMKKLLLFLRADSHVPETKLSLVLQQMQMGMMGKKLPIPCLPCIPMTSTRLKEKYGTKRRLQKRSALKIPTKHERPYILRNGIVQIV